MTAMFRVASLLMMLVLAMPMLRECCLPTAQALPCHESKDTNDVTCSSNVQAVTESKATAAFIAAHHYEYRLADNPIPALLTQSRCVAKRTAVPTIPASDLYLRTGVLLI